VAIINQMLFVGVPLAKGEGEGDLKSKKQKLNPNLSQDLSFAKNF
jgi:hypothetical protein